MGKTETIIFLNVYPNHEPKARYIYIEVEMSLLTGGETRMFEGANKFYDRAYKKGLEMLYTDEKGEMDALGIILALGTVVIGMYIIAIVTGSIDYSVQSGNILMTGQFNTTIDQLSTNAATSFSLANIVPIAIVGIGVLGLVLSYLGRSS
jgi:uncharacterized membrane protein YhfC